MSARPPIVAIDGPAGAGKSTVARLLARSLGFLLIDTGALYRTVALATTRRQTALDDPQAISALAERLVADKAIGLATGSDGTETRVTLDGEDVSTAIRTPEMSRAASAVSAIPGVRAALLDLQRSFGARGGVVLEGRDIGTVVFPDAEAKFFVTASPEVRARRRYDELLGRGSAVSFDETLAEVMARDTADRTRVVAPLIPAADAELVDTSSLSIEAVVEELAARVRSR